VHENAVTNYQIKSNAAMMWKNSHINRCTILPLLFFDFPALELDSNEIQSRIGAPERFGCGAELHP
jgi:hypothetical protein